MIVNRNILKSRRYLRSSLVLDSYRKEIWLRHRIIESSKMDSLFDLSDIEKLKEELNQIIV